MVTGTIFSFTMSGHDFLKLLLLLLLLFIYLFFIGGEGILELFLI